MNTVFDEKKYCEDLLENKPEYVRSTYLFRLVKYYKYLGFNKSDTMIKIKEFCKQCDSKFNFTLADPMLRKVENSFSKGVLSVPKDIPVTQKELDSIRSVNDYKKEKILFVLLVLSKFKHGNNKDYWVNEIQETNLFKLAKLSSSKNDRDKIMYELNRDGFTEIPRDDKKSIIIKYVDILSDEYEILVTDMDNMISFYPFYCEKCGKTIEQITYKKKICDECYEGDLRKRNLLAKKKQLNKRNS